MQGQHCFKNLTIEQANCIRDLGRTLFGGRGTGKLNRLAAAAGLAGKGAALGGTVVGTAHEMQGGNLFSPLSAGYKYDAMDPSGKFLAGRVEAGQEGAENYQNEERARMENMYNPVSYRTPLPTPTGTYDSAGVKPVAVTPPQSIPLPTPTGTYDSANAQPTPTVTPAPPIPAMPQPPNVAPISPPPPAVSQPAVPQPAVPQPALQSTVPQPAVPQPALNPTEMAESYTGLQKPAGPVVPPHQPATITNENIINTATELNNRIKSPTDIVPNANAMLDAQVYPPEPSGVQTKLTQINPQAIAAQESPIQPTPIQQALATLEKPRSYERQASTANPLRTDINYANNILDSQGRKNIYGIDDTDWGQRQDQSLGNDPNFDWKQWEKNQPGYMKLAMLKAYIKKLYDEFGGYMYKMTPHEAGQFAVYTLFTLRK